MEMEGMRIEMGEWEGGGELFDCFVETGKWNGKRLEFKDNLVCIGFWWDIWRMEGILIGKSRLWKRINIYRLNIVFCAFYYYI